MKLASVEAITRALDAAGVPFIVVGGLAVVAHGYGPQTQDVAIVESLLRLKRAAGRPQDLADIAELQLLHGEAPNA